MNKVEVLAANQDEWRDLGAQYASGRLAGLREFRRSRHALVEYGAAGSPSRHYYFKTFYPRNYLDFPKQLVRGSNARRALRGAELLARKGFEVPEAVCLVEKQHCGILSESALITVDVGEAPVLCDLLRDPSLGVALSAKRKRELIEAVACEVARMHNQGLYHGDMNASNILCRLEEGEVQFVWLDCERAKQFRRLPLSKRIHNLMQLNKMKRGLTERDRLRFWRTYCRETQLAAADQIVVSIRAQRITRKRWAKGYEI